MAFFLITGGAGFIGSNLVSTLVKRGYQVRILDNFSTGNIAYLNEIKNINQIEIIKGDVRDYQTCFQAAKQIDYVFHLAAISSVPESIKDPLITNRVNIDGTLNILKAAKLNKVKRVILASSSAVYGKLQTSYCQEDELASPVSPYGISKYSAELYARYFAKVHGLKTVSLRYFNVFGPRYNYHDVISIFINKILNNNRPLIFGTGEQTRDFIYIDDIIKANLLAYSNNKVGNGEVINIGSEKMISINQLYLILIKIMGSTLKPVYNESRIGDIENIRADLSKAKDLLDFAIETEFEEGLIKTYQWYKSRYKRVGNLISS